jgi:hypothetical protein
LGRRSRKARRAAGGVRAPLPPPRPAPPPERPARLRGEARNQAIRESLEPLAPGERPVPVTIAAIVAAGLAVANIALLVGGYDVPGRGNPVAGGIVFAVLMVVAAVGLWKARYWAVLGFEALLAIALIVFALFLLRASTVLGALVAVAVLVLGGWLFFKLVRAMARIQMPRP